MNLQDLQEAKSGIVFDVITANTLEEFQQNQMIESSLEEVFDKKVRYLQIECENILKGIKEYQSIKETMKDGII